jgi:PTS system ascorbate-specific IIA component
MSVGVLLVTHGRLGQLLLDTIAEMIGPLPLPSGVLEVRRVLATDALLLQGRRMIERLEADAGDGVLMLTDAFGSTPSNIATRLAERPGTALVAGVNLPMLLRVFNYPQLDLAAMTRTAVEGGQRGIVAGTAPGASP